MGLNVCLRYRTEESNLTEIQRTIFEPILQTLKKNRMWVWGPGFWKPGRIDYDFIEQIVEITIYSNHPIIGYGNNRKAYREIKDLLDASKFRPTWEHIWT
jgi:hypothetical protein